MGDGLQHLVQLLAAVPAAPTQDAREVVAGAERQHRHRRVGRLEREGLEIGCLAELVKDVEDLGVKGVGLGWWGGGE